jgi:hypothetical protein
VLLSQPGWAVLLSDLQDKADSLSYQIVHKIPSTDEAVAGENFLRGKVSAFEDLLGLAEELKQWKADHKK